MARKERKSLLWRMSDPNTTSVCQPLTCLETVTKWQPPRSSWARKVKPRQRLTSFRYREIITEDGVASVEKIPADKIPKTLVCHDMRGGYLEDKHVDGCSTKEAYTFFRWAGIDIFVYFSHHFVTIPPVTWINAAHSNGVYILGTIITEGVQGQKLFEGLLKDPKACSKVATKLTSIAQYYGFDGYLLNVENHIDLSQMGTFLEFIQELRNRLKEVDQSNVLIWYDSVTEPTGKLRWQNCLNKMNKTFFDITDGIFLNYGWHEQDLVVSKDTAGDRFRDVFVGIDVFGRNTHYKPGFECSQAMESIRKRELSVAIFAPGWVFEACENDERPYLERDYIFWSGFFKYLYLAGPAQLPFTTSFCIGMGDNKYKKGKIAKKGEWYNPRLQTYQLPECLTWHDENECRTKAYTAEDAFRWGNCLVLHRPTEDIHDEKLLVCEFKLTQFQFLMVKIATKTKETRQGGSGLQLYVIMCNPHGVERKIILKEIAPLVKNKCGWRTRTFKTDPEEGTVIEIGCRLIHTKQLLLGELSVFTEDLTN